MPVRHSRYREGGTPTIDEKACVTCGECTKICPGEVLLLEEGRIRVNPDAPLGCIACGHCTMVCPTGAVTVTGRGLSPDDLLPLPPPEERAGADALEALMRSRRSTRRFREEEVAPELLDRIVAMAESAPMGIPPWDVSCVVVRGRREVQDLTAEIIKGYEGFLKMFRPLTLMLMRPLLGKTRYEQFKDFLRPLAQKYVDDYRRGDDVLFYGAPAVLLFSQSPYAEALDASIACTYAMLAAESLGLGSTIIGGAAPVLQRNKALSQQLGIPAAHKPCTALVVGHPATTWRHAIRRHFLS
ncbi:MAG: nitroreductase family protein [Armatimonadetes bacterium]|nr:nitroreductase family protein [Armatimonadota bacterium]